MSSENSTIIALPSNQNFSSYKALCEALSLPVLSGKAKTIQLRNLEEFFSWKRIGNSYRILETKKPFLAAQTFERKPQEGVWLQTLVALILNDLSEDYLEWQEPQPNKAYQERGFYTKNTLINYGFCNENVKLSAREVCDLIVPDKIDHKLPPASSGQSFLSYVKENSKPLLTPSELGKYANLSEEALLSMLLSKIHSKGNAILSTAFEHLKRRQFITYRYSYSFFKDKKTRLASPEEEAEISAVNLRLLQSKEINCMTLAEVYLHGLQELFFSRRASILEDKGIHFCRRTHIIGFTAEHLSLAQTYRKELNELMALRKKVNRTSEDYFSAFFLKEGHDEKAKETLSKGISFVVPI